MRFKLFTYLSPIVLCYILGILIGNYFDTVLLHSTIKTVSEVCLLIAIPLLLFSTDIKAWFANARSTVVSFFVCIFAVAVSSFITGIYFSEQMAESPIMSGMLVGVYTGGTPNLASIGYALGVKQDTFVALHASDTLICGIYLIFLTTIAKPILSTFLSTFVKNSTIHKEYTKSVSNTNSKDYFKDLGKGIVFSALIMGVSVGLTLLIYGSLADSAIALLVLFLTTFSILLSFNKNIRNLDGIYDTGQYLLLVFSLAIGTQAKWSELMSSGSEIFLFTACVMLGAVIIHYILAFLFKIDADTVIITSTAAIFGPVFVGQVAGAINNRSLIFSGMVSGLMGYAIGNYLGLSIAYLLEQLL